MPVSLGLDRIHRIMLTVQIRLLVQKCIAGCEAAGLRIIISGSDLHQAGIAIGAVTRCCGKLYEFGD